MCKCYSSAGWLGGTSFYTVLCVFSNRLNLCEPVLAIAAHTYSRAGAVGEAWRYDAGTNLYISDVGRWPRVSRKKILRRVRVYYSCRLRGAKSVHWGNGLPLLALRHLVSLPVSTPFRIVNCCWSCSCKWRYINVDTFNLFNL